MTTAWPIEVANAGSEQTGTRPGLRAYTDKRFLTVLILLVASIPSYLVIPFYRFWAVDLHHPYVFHNCEFRNSPYHVPGELCGDVEGRNVISPPLLYWSFIWLRYLSFESASILWSLLIPTIFLPLFRFWVPFRWRTWIFWCLLGAQYPLMFSIERGNIDIAVVFLWSLSFWCYQTRKYSAAGACAGFASMLKLYPATAAAVIGLAILVPRRSDTPKTSSSGYFVAGLALSILGACLVWPFQTMTYFTEILPRFAGTIPPFLIYSHSLPALTEGRFWLSTAISFFLLAIWMVAARKRLEEDAQLIFAGSLAISTYFAATSYDYNLITAYPLLLILFERAIERPGRDGLVVLGFLVIGLVAIVGNRCLFLGSPLLERVPVSLQLSWLALVATYCRSPKESRARIEGVRPAALTTIHE